MKSTIFATVFALAIATVSAQLDISSIPSCATTCAITSISGTACSTSDFSCICHDSSFIDTLKPCIVKDCDAADQDKMVTLAQGLCSSYGVAIPSDVLSSTASVTGSANGTATITSVTSTGTATTSTSTSTSTNGAVKMAGSGFAVAAMGAAMFVL